MTYAEITGWGKALPPIVLSNSDLERIVDTNDDWITSRTGMKERRISHVEVSELSTVAAAQALAAAGLEPGDVDLLITATCTPETIIPPTSAVVQSKLGLNRAGAFDLNANCSGFVYGMVVASDMIKSGSVKRVLLVGAEKLSYIVDYTDRTTCVLFGDAAGAAVLEATDEPVGVLASELGVDGDAAPFLCVPQFGTLGGPGPRDPEHASLYMEGQEVFRRAVTKMGEASVNVVGAAGWSLDDVDLLIPHQANLRIIDATARRLGIESSKVFVNVHAYGNTSAATVPVALTEALESGRVTPGAHLVFAAFGGGLTWAAAAVRWGNRVEPLATSDMRVPDTDKTVWDVLEPNFEFFGRGGDRE
ncbi:MAG: ketoacyl-ACP synthase III [Acidimicrobiia bacterium]|nr:ketoacyl-ACP synthase III [Acidimicrobiia bacterium]MDH4306197.1 ketoacyl-ACP synthase III [Acidimicrobiia bacterium]MDH5294745.1 ketoacyl-ACP synthase III [Acidimicrobiia bacterium]